MTGPFAAGFFGATADFAQQLYSSGPASVAGISGTLKRKHAGDDCGSLLTSDSQFEIAKRQKYATGCHETMARGSGKESSGFRFSHPISYQPTVHANSISITESSKPCSGHTWHKSPAQCSSVSAETPKRPQTLWKGTMNVSNRKQHFIYTPDDTMKDMMKKYVYDVYKFFDDSHNKDDCWLHPSPPTVRRNGRPMGTIQCNFVWKDSFGKHRLLVNFGIVALIIKHRLTEEQMEGYVNEAWHLSHLCGNWICCNWRHMTVESGRINTSRNQCFPDATHCLHDPQCMKERKRRLLVTLKFSKQITKVIRSTENGAMLATGCKNASMKAAGFDCGICGKSALCFCRCTLTSIMKSQEALEKLELNLSSSDEILKAIAYLKQIIVDLINEKEASDAVIVQRAVAQPEVDHSAHWSQKQLSFYGQMLALFLD